MESRTYYAVHRGNTNDEIMHWKYIKKIKKNGKWRYYYDTSELDKYKNNEVETKEKGNKTYVTEYKQAHDKIFDSTSTITTNIGGSQTQYKTLQQGELSRLAAKGEKVIYDNFMKKNSFGDKLVKNFNRFKKKGKDAISKLLNR